MWRKTLTNEEKKQLKLPLEMCLKMGVGEARGLTMGKSFIL